MKVEWLEFRVNRVVEGVKWKNKVRCVES